MTAFEFSTMFDLGEDNTEYRRLTDEHVSVEAFGGRDILQVAPEGLTLLAQQAFKDVSHLLRSSNC